MKTQKIIFVVILVFLAFLTSWYFIGLRTDGEGSDNFVKDLNFTIEEYPRVDGSTSTHPLGVLISVKLLDVDYDWEEATWDGTKRLVPKASGYEEKKIEEYIKTEVIHYGTHGSYVNLIEDKTDLILVARPPSKDELELANSLGVELESRAIALDAFIFVLNEKNPIKSLTIREIQDIYTGKITNWKEVGGRESDINPYQRDPNSGSQELMEALVMKDMEMIDAPEMILYGMMGPINYLSDDEDGIGYSVYFFEEFMAPNENIKLLEVDDVIPNYENIKTRNYPFTTEVYVVIRNDLDENSNAYKLKDWLLSEGGQKVVKESGYVPYFLDI